MKMIPTPRIALIALATFTLAACEIRRQPSAAPGASAEEKPIAKLESLRAGTYATGICFLNRPASEGIGMDIYTHAHMTFDANGIGTNHFALYDDPNCVTPLGEGTMNIVMSVAAEYGDVIVFKLEQDDPAIEGDTPQIVYLTAVNDGENYRLDVDSRNGATGPYATEPIESDVAGFAANPSRGVPFVKQ
jgi:hypothetical protein